MGNALSYVRAENRYSTTKTRSASEVLKMGYTSISKLPGSPSCLAIVFVWIEIYSQDLVMGYIRHAHTARNHNWRPHSQTPGSHSVSDRQVWESSVRYGKVVQGVGK